MSASENDLDTPLPSLALRRFAWGTLAYFIATILWGTVVRATGSGAGCGEHWPLCNGTVLQAAPSVQTMIEFAHRITSGLDGILVVILLVWTFRGTVSGHLARYTAAASFFFTLTEGALGALLVKLGYTAQSHAPMRAPFLALHLANTLMLVAVLAMTAHMLGRTVAYRWRDVRLTNPLGTTIGMLAVMVVGITGSMAALGDTLFPPTSLSEGLQQDLSGNSEWLLRWRWTHPTVAIVASIFLIWLLIRAARRGGPWDNRKLSGFVVALLALQYVLGEADVYLLAPVWMQVIHLLGADVVWSALVVLTARLTLLPRD